MDTHQLAKRYRGWKALANHRETWKNTTLQQQFEKNLNRAQRFSIKTDDLLFDFSKNHLTEETLKLLQELAREANLKADIDAMFGGGKINHTEQRKVLHVALRKPTVDPQLQDETSAVQAALAKMEQFIDDVHSERWLGFTGHAISDVVNIGIGGSDLGPRMATYALAPFHQNKVNVHFVANIDGADLWTVLKKLQPQTTLFIVASKSFTTLETLENALTARQWMLKHGCGEEDIAKHFVAISSAIDKAVAFGIAEDNIFPMWDWVGGRYSLWSAIGMPIALAVGMESFRQLLNGAHAMDEHFRTQDFGENIPVLMALTTFWYAQFWNAESQAILPYYHWLKDFPSYLQQLDMESLGKGVDREGNFVDYPTGLIIWGSEGTNGQHSFYQLLHQGRRVVPTDFIVARKARHPFQNQQEHLYACCLSQTQALMMGKSLEQAEQEFLAAGLDSQRAKELAPHKVVPGNRPSNTFLMEELSPRNLGALIAAYEHKVYVLSVLLNINAFDQWGVELGKQLSGPIHDALVAKKPSLVDSSTQQLIDYFKTSN